MATFKGNIVLKIYYSLYNLIFMSDVVSSIANSNLTRCQSRSSPALLVLDELAYRTNLLNHRVYSFGKSLRASRSSCSLPNSPTKFVMADGAKEWTCHACHAPCSMHTQIPSGLNRCPLDHYEGV